MEKEKTNVGVALEKNIKAMQEFDKLRDELENQINAFDDKLHQMMQGLFDYDYGTQDCKDELDEHCAELEEWRVKRFRTLIAQREEWCKVWNSLSNGIRCVLGD